MRVQTSRPFSNWRDMPVCRLLRATTGAVSAPSAKPLPFFTYRIGDVDPGGYVNGASWEGLPEAGAPPACRAGEGREAVAQQQVLEHQLTATVGGSTPGREQQRHQNEHRTRITGPLAPYARGRAVSQVEP